MKLVDYLKSFKEVESQKVYYDQIVKSLKEFNSEYNEKLRAVQDTLGQGMLDSLQKENIIFNYFKVSSIEISNVVNLILSPNSVCSNRTYMEVVSRGCKLYIPLFVNTRNNGDLRYGMYEVFFIRFMESLNITELQNAWTKVCDKFSEEIDFLLKSSV